MKLFKYLFISLALIMISTGCSGNKEIITLTKDNIEDYFIVSESIEDYSVDTVSTIIGTNYKGYATLKITMKPKYDVVINNVIVTGTVSLSQAAWSYTPIPFEIQFDKDGYGEFTKSLVTSQSLLRPNKPSAFLNEFTEITGTIEK